MTILVPVSESMVVTKSIPRPVVMLGKLYVWAVVTLTLCMPNVPPAFGQSSTPASSHIQASPVPLPHLYWRFLMHQNHLDKAAAALEQQGKDGTRLRHYYQQRLGFTDQEFANVREAARRLESDLKTIDAQAQTLTKAERAQHPRVMASPHDLPPVSPQLLDLKRQREAVIQRNVDSLKSALGPKLAAKLGKFLETQFNPNVAVQPVRPPQTSGPSRP